MHHANSFDSESLRRTAVRIGDWMLDNLWILFCLFATVAFGGYIVHAVFWPAYKEPTARMYTSGLGYASVLRKSGKPFPVTTAVSQRRNVTGRFLGEGMMRSEPIQVPIIAMSRILSVSAKEGDHVTKGQKLIELDPTRVQIKIDAAQTQLKTAEAEFERTRLGSAYVLEKERPEREAIRLGAAKTEAGIRNELDELYGRLTSEGLMSQEEALLKRIENTKALASFNEAQLSMDVSKGGRVQSLAIAEAAIADAKLSLAYRQNELRDYTVTAPADGIIERCLVHEGEYNQDPGKPAFLLMSGLWFEAYFDQTAIGQFAVGDAAEVHLEAYPDRTFPGKITQIQEMVSYSLGGPETNRPIRPLGTGAPEWPATFAVRIQVDGAVKIVPGLTGFAKVVVARESNAVPRGAVTSISGGKALVFAVDPNQRENFEPREVTVGRTSGGWTEILSGLDLGVEVITGGQQVLQPGDRIAADRKSLPKSESENDGRRRELASKP